MDSPLPFRQRTLVTLASLLALVGVGIVSRPVLRRQQTTAQYPVRSSWTISASTNGKLFGYGGITPAAMPNIDAIAEAGIKFHNLWAMPACSNGRAALFTGRYPFRTHVYTAFGNNDLANFMVNPNEVTATQLLKQRGYKSALFGKFHMGIQSNNPYGYGMVRALGFDYFDGWLDATGDPSSIDGTAGGVSPPGTWSCGFVRDSTMAAQIRAPATRQQHLRSDRLNPGRRRRVASAATPVASLIQTSRACNPTPGYINFATLSGHYVSPLVINNEDGSIEQVPSTDLRARTYRGTEPVDAAIDWINQQPKSQPWMVSLAFRDGTHPVMQPPSQLLPPGGSGHQQS